MPLESDDYFGLLQNQCHLDRRSTPRLNVIESAKLKNLGGARIPRAIEMGLICGFVRCFFTEDQSSSPDLM